MTNNEMPSMESLAPLIDHLQEIADDELPEPKTLRVWMWDDGDYRIYLFHKISSDEREQIVYDGKAGTAVWQHLKDASKKYVEVSVDGDTMMEPVYEEKEEHQIHLDDSVEIP